MTITTLSRDEIAARDHPRWRARLASAGRPFLCAEVMVADAEDRGLPPGEAGEVLCRGGMVMPGYWRDPEASAAALRGGWLHTGDIGVLDEDGYLTLMDRSKDLVISGGANIYPREVEEVLLTHPAVREAHVVGVSDPVRGENVAAFVVLRDGATATPEALQGFCRETLASYKVPRRIFVVEAGAIPRTGSGKVEKAALRRAAEERSATSPAPTPAGSPGR